MFSEGNEFDVRYYSIAELLELFKAKIGSSEWCVDCFLGLNVHAAERDLVPAHKKWIIDIAEALLWTSNKFPFVRKLGDSVFVSSTKS